MHFCHRMKGKVCSYLEKKMFDELNKMVSSGILKQRAADKKLLHLERKIKSYESTFYHFIPIIYCCYFSCV